MISRDRSLASELVKANYRALLLSPRGLVANVGFTVQGKYYRVGQYYLPIGTFNAKSKKITVLLIDKNV